MRFLFVDRILQLSPGQFIRGLKHVTPDDFYLCKDDKGKLAFITSLIGETLGQLAAWNVMSTNNFTKRPVAGFANSARIYRKAFVGDTLLLESFIDSLDDTAVQYHSVARIGDEVVFTIDGALGPLLPMDDFIDSSTVRRQFDEINRPGEWPWPTPPTERLPLLPTTDNQLISAPMVFDRVIEHVPGVSMSAEKKISYAAPYFPDHFPKKPVLPLTVLLECSLNLATLFLADSPYAGQYKVSEVRRVKMSDFVYPSDVVLCYLTVKIHQTEKLILNCRIEVEGKRVCILDVVMLPKEREQ